MLRWLAGVAASRLQNLYEAHRVPETWGTPSVSQHVFSALRHQGFWAAGKELTTRMRAAGMLGLSTAEKIMVLAMGVGLVTLADVLLKGEEKPAITRRAFRTFSPKAGKFAVGIYMLGATLLAAASEGGPTGSGDGGVGEGTN